VPEAEALLGSVPEALPGAPGPETLPETLLGRLPELLAAGEPGGALRGLVGGLLLFADVLRF
jgi:hypothetical protein